MQRIAIHIMYLMILYASTMLIILFSETEKLVGRLHVSKSGVIAEYSDKDTEQDDSYFEFDA